MFKTIQIIVMGAFCLNFSSKAQSQNTSALPSKQAILGKVISATTGESLPGAVIKITTSNHSAVSNDKGEFILSLNNGSYNLSISHTRFETKYINIQIPLKEQLIIVLDTDNKNLQEVEIISTGYQNLSKERAIGSFEQINNELIDRKVGLNILNRLDGQTSILFDKRITNPQDRLQLRGVSSMGLLQPLLIIDNFPYEGNIDDINPNDVDNITLLKDAAATSIWGSRAGNGVIVITTKKGKYNKSAMAAFSSNLTLINKPDLFDIQQLSPSEAIDLEIYLFNKGFYDGALNDVTHPPISQVVEILHKKPLNALAQIDVLRKFDVRNDFEKYIYRRALNQQYNAELSGGSNNVSYRFSTGYDNNYSNLIGNDVKRITFRSANNIELRKNLQLQIGLAFTQNRSNNNNPGDYFSANYQTYTGNNLSPYTRLVDDDGRSLPILKSFSQSYLDTLGGGRLLDWNYRPVDEIALANNVVKSQAITADLGLKYQALKIFNFQVKYQYRRSSTDQKEDKGMNTFFTRDMINNYTNLVSANLNEKYPVPIGSILDLDQDNIENHNIRGQLNIEHVWHGKHWVSIMAGGELREKHQLSNGTRTYGYNDRLNIARVDYVKAYRTYSGFNTVVPNANSFTDLTYRNASVYGNANYSFDNKYTLFGSARKDGSNLFGIKTTNNWNPLWSAGISWNIYNEKFYQFKLIRSLKLRATYGYSGNVFEGQSAYTTLNYQPSGSVTNLPYATIGNPPNPDLRWEKVRTMNLGIDMQLIGDRLDISFDYFRKKSTDVFGTQSLDPTTGLQGLRTNSMHMNGNGFEFQLNSININLKKFRWRTNFQLNNSSYTVTKYLLIDQSTTGFTSNGEYMFPLTGFNPYAVVSNKWAGLDPVNGDPRGILNGEISKDYRAISLNTLNKDMVIHGSAIPTIFGNLLNTFNWKQISLSFNLTYKLGYYFRKPTLNYYKLFNLGDINSEYLHRWQKAGDEKFTNVPSIVYPNDNNRSTFYEKAEINVGRGDNIRINDFRLGYNINKKLIRELPVSNIEISIFSNINILLWKANIFGLDPDYPAGIVPPKSIATSLKVNL